MIVKFGTFAHDNNEVALSIGNTSKLNEAGAIEFFTETWDLDGFLQADDQLGLNAKIKALEDAYATGGKDLSLLFDNGSTLSAHFMSNSQSLGGTRIVSPPSYPEGTGAEYTTFRRYNITVAADFLPSGSFRVKFLDFQERLTFTGGGPRFIMLQALNGPPQRQRVAERTAFRLVQSGSQIGQTRRFPPNPPLFPQDEHRDQRQITEGGPVRNASGRLARFTEFSTSWQYTFEAINPFRANPTPWRE